MASKAHLPHNFFNPMQLTNKPLDKNTAAISYKLLHDSLFVLIIFFLLTLIAEGILPGIIISHIGFSKLVFLLLGNILLLKILAKKNIPVGNVKKNDTLDLKKIAIPLSALGALLVLNSQLGMDIFLNIFILALAGAISYLSYQILFNEE
jgi:hypothetical protein